ncbi:hypothetical protein AB1Y20_022610 [Prymnesium parvum]|uniref:J domain-containing protein n=1 Tax=Prymnesium parvum TaxID=97485 RepID=A0AB34JGD0_PRYPA
MLGMRRLIALQPRLPPCRLGFCSRAGVDYFALLGAERRFDLDPSTLHASYRERMAGSHPDRFGSQGSEAVQEASEHSSKITEAYNVLRYPHHRAMHLLSLLGVPLTEETSGEELGPDFLAEVMEVREQLADEALDQAALLRLRGANQKVIDEVSAGLTDAFGHSDLALARRLTARLQYLYRIEENIRARLDAT